MKTKTKIACLVFVFLYFALPQPVYAYIDPATTTYVIQIISALVITLSVTIGLFFSRLRLSLLNLRVRLSGMIVRLFSKKKGGRRPAPRPPAAYQTHRPAARQPAAPLGKWNSLWQDDRRYSLRLPLILLVSFAFSFTFIFFGIYELYMLNLDSFMFPLGSMLFPLTAATAACAAALIVVLSLIQGRLFDFIISLLSGILLAGYIQRNFLNRGLGELSGDRLIWDTMRHGLMINLLIWTLLISLPFLLHYFRRRTWTRLIKSFCLLLIMIQLISMLSLYSHNKNQLAKSGSYLSTDGINDVSTKQNIIVIVLDRLDNRYLEKVLESDPDFFAPLDGFTRFSDNMSLYSQTFPSVANMFSGQLYDFKRPRSEYLKQAWQTSEVMPALHDSGYRVHLYMEQGYTFDDASDLKGIADNVAQNKITVQQPEALEQFLLLTAFRSMPLSMKPFFWTSTDQFSKLVTSEAESAPYVTDDLLYFQNLSGQKLKPSDRSNLFTYLHLNGPHAPYVMNELAQAVPAEQSGSIIQTKGSFHIVYEYLRQLKALGLYENSTIVITGDHGSRRDDTEPLESAIVTGLFVKPAGRAGQPLAHNHAQVSSDNLRPFILAAAGLPHTASGQTYFEVPEDAPAVRFLYHRLRKTETQPERLLTYEIKGNANDFANWRLIEDKVTGQ